MTLGFIGAGKMGSALLAGIQRANFCRAQDVMVHDIDPVAMSRAAAGWSGTRTAPHGRDVFAACDTVLLCVKPDDIQGTLEEASGAATGCLVISIAAGKSLRDLDAWSGNAHRVVRVMPNSPALIGHGASAYAMGSRTTPADAVLVEEFLRCVGHAFKVNEDHLDAATGLSGSGPAYVYMVIEALTEGGVLEGLPRSIAAQLAVYTVAGAAAMVMQTKEHPAVLRDQVTSPKGTTAAALAKLEERGLRSALIEAVRTASRRSAEIRTESLSPLENHSQSTEIKLA